MTLAHGLGTCNKVIIMMVTIIIIIIIIITIISQTHLVLLTDQTASIPGSTINHNVWLIQNAFTYAN